MQGNVGFLMPCAHGIDPEGRDLVGLMSGSGRKYALESVSGVGLPCESGAEGAHMCGCSGLKHSAWLLEFGPEGAPP